VQGAEVGGAGALRWGCRALRGLVHAPCLGRGQLEQVLTVVQHPQAPFVALTPEAHSHHPCPPLPQPWHQALSPGWHASRGRLQALRRDRGSWGTPAVYPEAEAYP